MQTLHIGNKSHQLLATAQPSPAELYSYSPSKEDEPAFAGVLSHNLAMNKVKVDLAGTDAVLAMLQSQMASHEQSKQSKQYVHVFCHVPFQLYQIPLTWSCS